MSNIIDSIQLSGTVYTIQGTGGGGSPTVELTQAEYDALVSAGTVSANTYYIITDAQAGDLTQYWTSAQTQSAITEATSGKQDTLVSGTNIKTINNESILGSGNIDIQGGGTASSAITSGDTNAIAGGAVYNKFDEIEQVIARALNQLNAKIAEIEEVVARALNQLNDRITALENA